MRRAFYYALWKEGWGIGFLILGQHSKPTLGALRPSPQGKRMEAKQEVERADLPGHVCLERVSTLVQIPHHFLEVVVGNLVHEPRSTTAPGHHLKFVVPQGLGVVGGFEGDEVGELDQNRSLGAPFDDALYAHQRRLRSPRSPNSSGSGWMSKYWSSSIP